MAQDDLHVLVPAGDAGSSRPPEAVAVTTTALPSVQPHLAPAERRVRMKVPSATAGIALGLCGVGSILGEFDLRWAASASRSASLGWPLSSGSSSR